MRPPSRAIPLLSSLAALLLPSMPMSAADAGDSSIAQVTVTFQETDPFLPWQMMPPGVRGGYAVAIAPDTFLTTETLVRSHRLVELRRPRSGEKITATVLVADCEVNLALLRIPDPARMPGILPLPLAETLGKKDTVDILQLDETAQVQHGSAQVFQAAMNELPKAPYQSLTFSVLADHNVNGEGAPALFGPTLAGLVMSYEAATRTAHLIPPPVIRRFVSDALDPPYKGFASAGFFWDILVDPAKREFLKITRDGMGILVLGCTPGSGSTEVLKPNDVILEWDGRPVDSLGFYDDPDLGRMAISYLIKGRRCPGDTVPVTLCRDGKELTVQLKLIRRLDEDALIPENTTAARTPYLVEGGLVLTELTGRYLRAHGPDWDRVLDPRISHIYYSRQQEQISPRQKIILLTGVLPDPINTGYQHFRNDIVTAINGQSVSNMTDVFHIADRDGHIARLTLKGLGVDIALDTNQLDSANERLVRQYRVPQLRFDSKTALP